MKKTTAISIIHWTALITGTLMLTFTLFFFIGYMIEGHNKPGPGLNTNTIITFVFWGVGLAGLLLAIWKPGTGGLVSLLGFIVFNILAVFHTNPDAHYSVVLLIFLFPSILYLLYWWLKKSSNEIS
ncbi:MAG: hypothetical protein NTZ33_11160 [Bacteroidetes bacterium]|nr:hypothetical protein [Bacteroidota bacterium]